MSTAYSYVLRNGRGIQCLRRWYLHHLLWASSITHQHRLLAIAILHVSALWSRNTTILKTLLCIFFFTTVAAITCVGIAMPMFNGKFEMKLWFSSVERLSSISIYPLQPIIQRMHVPTKTDTSGSRVGSRCMSSHLFFCSPIVTVF